MSTSAAVQSRVVPLQAKAAEIRAACANAPLVDSDACGAAASAIDVLIEKMWMTDDAALEARYIKAADRILGRIGNAGQLVDGAKVSDLARDIAKDATRAVTIGGLGAVAIGGIALGLYFLATRGPSHRRRET